MLHDKINMISRLWQVLINIKAPLAPAFNFPINISLFFCIKDFSSNIWFSPNWSLFTAFFNFKRADRSKKTLIELFKQIKRLLKFPKLNAAVSTWCYTSIWRRERTIHESDTARFEDDIYNETFIRDLTHRGSAPHPHIHLQRPPDKPDRRRFVTWWDFLFPPPPLYNRIYRLYR